MRFLNELDGYGAAHLVVEIGFHVGHRADADEVVQRPWRSSDVLRGDVAGLGQIDDFRVIIAIVVIGFRDRAAVFRITAEADTEVGGHDEIVGFFRSERFIELETRFTPEAERDARGGDEIAFVGGVDEDFRLQSDGWFIFWLWISA